MSRRQTGLATDIHPHQLPNSLLGSAYGSTASNGRGSADSGSGDSTDKTGDLHRANTASYEGPLARYGSAAARRALMRGMTRIGWYPSQPRLSHCSQAAAGGSSRELILTTLLIIDRTVVTLTARPTGLSSTPPLRHSDELPYHPWAILGLNAESRCRPVANWYRCVLERCELLSLEPIAGERQ